MKKIKKIISVVLIMGILVILVACGSNTPTAEVDSVLGGLKKGKRDEVNNMVNDAINKSIFGTVEEISEEIPGGMTKDTQKIIDEIVSKMEYKINSETINKEKAVVNVTLKGGNISKAFMEYLGDMITLSYTSTVLADTPKEEYFLLVNSLFYEKLKAINEDERTLDIRLTKNDNKWKIEEDAAFFELLLGSSADKETGGGE